MTTYIVTRKSDGQQVYRYGADAPIPWDGFPFSEYDHAALTEPTAPVETPDPARWRIYVGSFFDRFGAYKLPILASQDALVQAIIKDCTVRRYIDLLGRRDELLQAIGLLQAKGFAVSAADILDAAPSDEEVFRG